MIGISTYGEPTNFFTKLLALKAPDGTPMFRQIEYSTICKKCLEKGVKEVCKHRRGELPHWHDADEYAQLFQILKDDPDIALKELGGVSVDSSNQAFFDQDALRQMDNEMNESDDNQFVVNMGNAHHKRVFISVDPCGEGTWSDYGVVSCVFNQGEIVVSTLFFFFHSASFAYVTIWKRVFLFPPLVLSSRCRW